MAPTDWIGQKQANGTYMPVFGPNVYNAVNVKSGDVQTAGFPRSASGPYAVTLPVGTYQILFIMPSACSGQYITFTVNNTGQSWNNSGTALSAPSDNVTFVNGTTYTITASAQ